MPDIEVLLTQAGASTSEAAIRQHRVLVDRPEAKGCADQGPMGGELFLSAIGGCFMSNLLAAIRSREVALENVSTVVTGTLDGTPTKFVAVSVKVSAEGTDTDQLEKLVTIADRGCIMTNTLRGTLDVQIELEQAPAAVGA